MTAGRTRLANDAWEALLSAHARLMKRFAADRPANVPEAPTHASLLARRDTLSAV